ncbi:MAG: hypothetical protein AMXMBFR44_2320 [Candidatus Campbellbacteria bacterium]
MYSNFKITKNKNATVTIEGELPHDELSRHRARVLGELGRDIELPGFRKGHVPEKLLISHVGEGALLQGMAEHALSEHYPKILSHHGIDAIGRPAVSLTKLAPGNPLGFKIETAIVPVLSLPDYKELAKKHVAQSKKEEVVVTEDEISKFIETALKEKNERAGKKDEPLPEITDELVKEFGAFTDVADFKAKIKDGLLHDKKHKARETLRITILQDITDHTKVVMPDILVEAELDKMYSQFTHDIERFGLKPDEYMTHIKKTPEDLRKEWRPDAEKAAKQQLILHDISVAEKIQPTADEIKKEVDHILSHHKDAKRPHVEAYVATALANQKVLEFLEKQDA